MPQVSMSQLTFDNLEEQIGQHPDQFKSFTKTSGNTGVIVTKDVTVDFLYNPLTQFLQFTIGAKHSLAARIAGDNIISDHIIATIHSLPPVYTKVATAPAYIKSSGIDGDSGDWTAAGDGTGYPETGEVPANPVEEVITGKPTIVVKTPTPATEVANVGTGSEQVS
jgi:hypothetical protein